MAAQYPPKPTNPALVRPGAEKWEWFWHRCSLAFCPMAGAAYDHILRYPPSLTDSGSVTRLGAAMRGAEGTECYRNTSTAANESSRFDYGAADTPARVRARLNGLTNHTIFFDVYYIGETADSETTPAIASSSEDGAGLNGWLVQFLHFNNSIEWKLSNTVADRFLSANFGDPLAAGRYTMLFRRTGDGSTGEWWQDGVLNNSIASKSITAIPSNTTLPILIGNADDGSWNLPFHGDIGAVYHFDVALSDAEMYQLFEDPYGWARPRPRLSVLLPVAAPAAAAKPPSGLSLLGVGT